MPRRKQDNPQHFEEEMKMEQLLGGDGVEFEKGLKSVETMEKNKIMDHRSRVEHMKHCNGVTEEAEDLSSLSSRDTVSRVEDTRPAVITNQVWQEVQTTLSSLQQQMQILRVQQLQLMQLLASPNQDGSNLSTTKCEPLDGVNLADKPDETNQNRVSQPSPDVTSADETRQEQQNHTPMKQDSQDLATAATIDLDEDDGKSLDTPTANGELEAAFDLGIPAVNEETGEPMSFDCTNCSAVLPSPELLRLHQLSHEKRGVSQAFSSVADTPTNSLPTSSSLTPGTLGSLPPSYQSIINDLSNDSLEEYMEIQKPENTHLEQLVKNMDGTVTDPNQCLICKRILSCKSALMMHYRTHTGERPFKCKLCSRAFTTKGNLKTHMGVHRAKPPLRLLHNCVICNKAFTNALVLNQHMKQHSDENSRKRNYDVPSSITSEECKRQRTLFNPDASYKEEPAADNTFDLVTRAMTVSDMHTLPSVSVGSAPPFPFDFAGVSSIPDPLRYAEIFARQWDQFGHYPMLPPIPPMKPPMFSGHLGLPVSMGLPFPVGAGLPSLPRPSIRTPFPFETGPEEAMNKAAKPKQPEVEAVEVESETQQNEKVTFDSSRGLNNSPKSERSWGSGEQASNGSSGFKLDPPPGTTCDICLKSFACRSALEIHYRSHTKHRPFKCDLCDKAFTTRGNMKQHILTHKSDEMHWNGGDNLLIQPTVPSPPSTELSPSGEDSKKTASKHQCSICLKYFSSASAVQIHFRTHTGDRPFKCSICGKAFTTKGNLKVHMGTHIWNGTTPITSMKSETSDGPSEVRKEHQEDESTPATSPGRPNIINNNSFSWGQFSQPSSLTKSPFLTSTSSIMPNFSMFGPPGGIPPPLNVEEQPKPWVWHLTCVVCHREMPSSTALELHMKSHMISDSGPSKPLATLQLT